MHDYVVFDVETPNRANDRMSAIGITIIRNGRIADDYYTLVDPETHFDQRRVRQEFTRIPGGVARDSADNGERNTRCAQRGVRPERTPQLP